MGLKLAKKTVEAEPTASTKVEVQKPSGKATISKDADDEVVSIAGFSLPTKKSLPQKDIGKLKWLIYGERKIGKTSFASCFPDALFLMFEPGGEGLEIYQEPVDSWAKFKAMVKLLIEKDEQGNFKNHKFKTVILDTADYLYMLCRNSECQKLGIKHPNDAGFGKGSDLIFNELATWCNKLALSGLGLVILSHAQEKEFLERTGGTFDKIIPTMPGQAWKYFGGLADGNVYYGYWGDTRLLTITGSDSVESGQRLKFQFWVKGKEGVERVHSISAGANEDEAYANFVKAFNNEQEESGKPKRSEFAALSDQKVPIKTK